MRRRERAVKSNNYRAENEDGVVLCQEFGRRFWRAGRKSPSGLDLNWYSLCPSQPPASPPGKAGRPADVCQELNDGHKPLQRQQRRQRKHALTRPVESVWATKTTTLAFSRAKTGVPRQNYGSHLNAYIKIKQNGGTGTTTYRLEAWTEVGKVHVHIIQLLRSACCDLTLLVLVGRIHKIRTITCVCLNWAIKTMNAA